MQTLNIYAHDATEQQRQSMIGQGIPLDFIKDIETGIINIDNALQNVKTHVAADNLTDYHTADIHCALAAVHFVIANREGHSDEMLEEIRKDFIKEMRFYLDNVSFGDKKSLEERLRNIVSAPHSVQ